MGVVMNSAVSQAFPPGFSSAVRARRLFCIALLASVLGACAGLPPGHSFPKTPSSALPNPETTPLGSQFNAAAQAHGGNSGFRIISVGADGFLTRIEMINAAQRTLDLQYYIFRSDDTGGLLTDAVLRAADRGVRVRVLIDDGETIAGDEQVLDIDAHPNIEVRMFNPFHYRGHVTLFRAIEFAFNASRLDYRMHNKLMVVDNAVALVGGRNIGDQYFQIDPDSQFADDDVFTGGPIVKKLSGTFDDYWKSPLAIPVAALSHAALPATALSDYRAQLDAQRHQMKADGIGYVQRIAGGEPFAGILAGRLPMVWAPAQVVCDSPEKKRVANGEMVGKLMQRVVANQAKAVHSELIMITPFLVPGKKGLQLLEDLRKRGVHVRVLTNSLESTPEILAHSGYMHYRVRMLEYGVELYEVRSLLGNVKGSGQTAKVSRYGNYALHAKLFVFDRDKVFFGSMNFDERSKHLNTEVGLIVDSPELAQQTAKRFAAMTRLENSYALELVSGKTGSPPHLVWHTREDGKDVSYDVEPARSDQQRLKVQLLSLLPLDKEL